MAESPDLRIFVTCPFDVRVRRIADREGRSIVDVENETRMREESELQRYKDYYGVDISDLSIYDVILNTSLFSKEAAVSILKCIVDQYVACG
jgi:cytidylate kinase